MILYTTADAPIAIELRICLSETFEKQHPTLEGFVRGREIFRTMSGLRSAYMLAIIVLGSLEVSRRPPEYATAKCRTN